jgi:hypothetical protein
MEKLTTLTQDWGDGYTKIAVTALKQQIITAIKFVTHWRTKEEQIISRFNALGTTERDTYIAKIKSYVDKHKI